MVVWADSFENITPLCHDLEEKMIKLVWRYRHIMTPVDSIVASAIPSADASNVNLSENVATEKIPISDSGQADSKPKTNQKSSWRWNWKLSPKPEDPPSSDPEKDGPAKKEPRPVRLYAPFYCGLAVALSICEPLHALSPFSNSHPSYLQSS